MRKIIPMLAATLAAGLLFVNIYNSLVDAANWGRLVPISLQTARDYFTAANPGTFFRVFSPANQLITLLMLIMCWKADKAVRVYGLMALLLAVGADVMTFGYFYPRNAILFNGTGSQDPAYLSTVLQEWRSMNWVRSALVGLNLIFDFAVLYRLQGLKSYHPKTTDHVLHVPAHY